MPTPVLIALIIVALPLLAWTVEFLYAAFKRRLPTWCDWLSTVAIGGSLLGSLFLMGRYVLPGGIVNAHIWSTNWISLGSGDSRFVLDFEVMVDNLTVIMLCVVTIVAFLVHVYSRSYMHGEDRYPRFFLHLSLFTFSMLGLVITSNLLMLFIFWELVGVCSYFLIGFFFLKQSAVDASKKAFVVNRIGDACFMAGIFLVAATLSGRWAGEDVLSFTRIWESVGLLGVGEGPWVGKETLLTVAGLLIFMGCVTKSAQFPLHVWLPDAMEGPTPVSALIHAATMVAAGVYMIVRMFPLLAGEGYLAGDYFHSTTLWVIAIVGGVTALFAGTIALVQTDLKKGLAYSTCSQLGYMVMAVGLGSLTAAMMHLFTHAFFKACLFLGSGSVIHAVHSQEMSDMGGLRKKMPITHWTFALSCCAIAGIPFFSGFLSKEAVLGQSVAYALHLGTAAAWAPFIMAGVTAILTSFYMFRLLFLTFWGKPADQHRFDHAHESPPAMTVPLVVLAVLAVISAGPALWWNFGANTWFQERVNDGVLVKDVMVAQGGEAATIFARHQVHLVHHHDAVAGSSELVRRFFDIYHSIHVPLVAFSLFAVFVGVGLSWLMFVKYRGRDLISGRRPLVAMRRVLANLYYVDWFYTHRIVPTVKDLTLLSAWIDKRLVDRLVNLAAAFTRSLSWFSGRIDAHVVDGGVRGTGGLMFWFGNFFRRLVTGKLQDYVKYSVFGMGLLVLWVILAH